MSQNNRPLASHPAFRYMVALWFAALLGFGTYVMPAGVFERGVEATGLAGILPAAAPPLGDTARLLISAVAALLGALLGLFVASRAGSDRPAGIDDGADEIVLPEPEAPVERGTTRRRPLLVREALSEDFPLPNEPVESEPAEASVEAGMEFEPDFAADAQDTEAFDRPAVSFAEAEHDDETEFAGDPSADRFQDFSDPSDDFDAESDFGTGVQRFDEAKSILQIGPVAEPDAPDGDLADLGRQLESALHAYRERMAGHWVPEEGDVVTFLRRTAQNGGSSDLGSAPESADLREELRSALAKLSQVGRDS
ncbi:hypothetical protein [Qipengyuania spongiae]|uniref:Uncharacterized protein n=1 Tax=Qipengyuania spongiae TaxID=2909673 RepID=A0ABY5T2Q2_9SPHN|nr:hypothetical protein [Qipengyuania spongiae]UVI39804.1 hypothetical protein L1F33_02240 [Qipengyuania spongiae]